MSVLQQQLIIDNDKLNIYEDIASADHSQIPPQHRIAYEVARDSLSSKQCNEPYERLISHVLGLYNNSQKHGFDAFDSSENPLEFYEYKPSSNTKNPSGTINDDTICKIDKYQEIVTQDKQVWVILAGINKQTFSFDSIYKFPAEIYDQDRRQYLKTLIEKNKNNTNGKQTRSTYSITVNKSIKLCKEFNKIFYVWKRHIF